jgi:transcriptional regulator with XRE-family HTH domain
MKKYFNKELLKCLMLTVDKSSAEIAREIDVSYSSFWNWINGLSFPWNRNAKKIADYFSVDVNMFWKERDDQEYNRWLKKIYMERYVK